MRGEHEDITVCEKSVFRFGFQHSDSVLQSFLIFFSLLPFSSEIEA